MELMLNILRMNTMISSTKTIIAVSNFNINLDFFINMFLLLLILLFLKKGEERQKDDIVNLNEDIPKGSIISAINANNTLRGIKLKIRKKMKLKRERIFLDIQFRLL